MLIDLTNEYNDDWLKVLPQNDKDLVVAVTKDLSEPNLALSLQEMGYEKSLRYLIEHGYRFRTDGKRIVILD